MTGRLAQADALKAHAGPPGRPDGQTPSLGVLGTPGPSVTPDQPAVQRRLDTRRGVPVLAAGPGRWPPGPGAHRQDRARRHRRIGHSRRLLPGPRVFDLVVAAVPLPLGIWLTLTRPARPDDPGRGADGIGRRRGMRGRDLRDRRRRVPGPGPDRVRPQAVRGRPRRPGYSMTPRTTLPCLPRAALRMNAAWAWASGKTESISGRRSPVPASRASSSSCSWLGSTTK